MGKSAKPAGKQSRIRQLMQAYQVTKVGDRKIGLILLGTFVVFSLVGIALFMLLPPSWLVVDIISGLLIGVLAVLIVFGRRATKSQLKQMEGKPGAAVAGLGILRRGWGPAQVRGLHRP